MSPRPPLRQVLREIMEPYTGSPDSTWLSLVVDLVVLTAILTSSAVAVWEHLEPGNEGLFWIVEAVFATLFIVEYLIRWYAAPNRVAYPFTLAAIIDFLAIVPAILILNPDLLLLRLVRGIRLLRILRLLRLVRLLKLFRYGHLFANGLLRMRIAMSAANYQFRLAQLGKLGVWIGVAWVVGANVVHFTEAQLADGAGPFADYWQSYWNILIVLVSGIEDKEPVSLAGRVEVTFLLFAGICAVGMFTAQLVSAIVRMAQRSGKVAVKPPSACFANHILILGANEHLDGLLTQLHRAFGNHHHIVVVNPDAEELPITNPAVYKNVFALSADPAQRHVLEQADLSRAARVIILSTEDPSCDSAVRDSRTLMITLAVVHANPGIPVVSELHTHECLEQASVLKSAEFVLSRRFGSRLIARAALRPGIADIYHHLMEFSDNSCELYRLPVPPRFHGKTFREVQKHLVDIDEEAVVLLGVAERDDPARGLHVCPAASGDTTPGSRPLHAGDELVVSAYRRPELLPVEKEELWTGKVLLRD